MDQERLVRQKAEQSAMAILEVAAQHYRLVLECDWAKAEGMAFKLAQMAAYIADDHAAIQRVDDESEME